MRLVIIGGSDAGISAGLRARELAPGTQVTMLVADHYPNFSICGIPYHVSGDVPDWRSLAHRTRHDIEATGIGLRLGETATAIDTASRTVTTRDEEGAEHRHGYDKLIIGTGASPARPPIAGLDDLETADGVHVLHSMADTFALNDALAGVLAERDPATAVIIGAGYIGMEMAEALTARGLQVTVLERLDQVLPNTLDSALAAPVQEELVRHGVRVHTGTGVTAVQRTSTGQALRLTCTDDVVREADLVLVVTGVRPEVGLAVQAGATLGAGGAIAVDEYMRTGLPGVYAAGDCVHTHHRLLRDPAYMPLGTTAHKQGRVAGANAVGADVPFAGVVGTQVVKIFDLVVAATGLRDAAAPKAGYQPVTVQVSADDHKAYYPGAVPLTIRLTGDGTSGRLLGAQIVGRLGAEIAKRIDILATGLHYGAAIEEIGDLDLSYTPPLGSPFDAVQAAAHAWTQRNRTAHLHDHTAAAHGAGAPGADPAR